VQSSTLEGMLHLTRRVFAGTVTRDEIKHRSIHERTFVATAIMYAIREDFLDDNGVVQGSYGNLVLDLTQGTYNEYAEEPQGYTSNNTVMDVARRMGFYTPQPGRGGVKPTKLHPPVELTQLVAELGYTPAIQEFVWQATVEGGKEIRRKRRATARPEGLPVSLPDVSQVLDGLLADVQEQYGRHGLNLLRAKLDRHIP